MKKFFKEFKQFITRGNVIDMAVGVIIASAFSAIVTALTNKIIMPLVNLLLSLAGGNGLESARTILGNPVYNTPGDATSGINWDSTIYIDWGSFITAVIDFILIALVLFIILKVMMSAKGLLKKTASEYPTRAERKELKANGVNMKDHKAVITATVALRDEKAKKEAEEKAKKEAEDKLAHPSQEELLKEIRDLLKEGKTK